MQSSNVIIIDGYYDIVSDFLGVDDNGIVMVGVLEVVCIFLFYYFWKSFWFIGFDFEEIGLDGSMYYVEYLFGNEVIEGVFNMEMIGYYSDMFNSQDFLFGFELVFLEVVAEVQFDVNWGNFLINVGLGFGNVLYNVFNIVVVIYVLELWVIGLSVVNLLFVFDLLCSDYGFFWEVNIFVLMFIDGVDFCNLYYYEFLDMIGIFNFVFMVNVVKVVIVIVVVMVEFMYSGEVIVSNVIIMDIEYLYEFLCSYFFLFNLVQEEFIICFGDCQFMQFELCLYNVKG